MVFLHESEFTQKIECHSVVFAFALIKHAASASVINANWLQVNDRNFCIFSAFKKDEFNNTFTSMLKRDSFLN
jgi:hypothetical protein